jgi:alcohol dehydrogenase
MRQLTFIEPGKVEYREVPTPRLEGPKQALVRPLAVSRCDLDLAIVRGKAPVPGPFALGHECIGEVVEVGDQVTLVRVGERVVVPFQISCGECIRCVRGQTGSCAGVPKLASFGLGPLSGGDYGGAVSDILRIPFADAMLVPLDPRLDARAAAALADNAVDGFRTVFGPLSREPNAPVLVAGGGARSVGLYAVAAARALGSAEVVYVDAPEGRCALAERLGARVVHSAPSEGLRLGRFPVTVDASSRSEGLRFCIASTDVDGECTSVGVYFGEVPLPLLAMYTRGIRFSTGRVNARRDLPAALALALDHGFDLTAIATDVLPFDAAEGAWGAKATKLVLVHEEALSSDSRAGRHEFA